MLDQLYLSDFNVIPNLTQALCGGLASGLQPEGLRWKEPAAWPVNAYLSLSLVTSLELGRSMVDSNAVSRIQVPLMPAESLSVGQLTHATVPLV